jgi:hypothetical protein
MGNGQAESRKYAIQPYHMNGLNWRLVSEADGAGATRDDIVVVMGFMPAWWTHEYGITFGRDFNLDPDVHRATLAQMEDILRERFGDMPNFFCGDDYAHAEPMERRFGDALIPALFGSEVWFEGAGGHPYAPEMDLTAAEAGELEVPQIADHPVTQLLLPPRDDTEGRTAGELGFEGVINIAHKLRGQELFLDMIDAPERARHVFEVAYETIDSFVHMVRAWQDPRSTRPTYFVTCNCLLNMISPRMYREQLLEFDRRFSESFDLFGIHTCNWTVDPYLDVLAELPSLAYLDMGEESDLERVHRLWPDLAPSVFVHPQRLREMTEHEIACTVTELGERIGRGYILLSDLEVGTRDSQIRAAYESAARL